MKNTRNLILVLFLMTAVTLGCSRFTGGGSDTNASSTPEATGIADCDRLFARIEEKVSDKNKETTFFERTAYNLIKDQMTKYIRDSVANTNEADKKDIARKCREAMTKMDETDDDSNSSNSTNSSSSNSNVKK